MAARLLIEYHGGEFSGWARQPGARTVQEVLEDALAKLLPEPVALTVAGRTDSGVHARGQVASHPGTSATAGALNGNLPPDVRVLASDDVADGFDARRDARSRTYRYRVLDSRVARVFERNRALHWRFGVEREVLDECAAMLPGVHDFTAFTPTQTYHQRFQRRVFGAEWIDEGDCVLAFWIEADSYMKRMVRTLVGTMLAIAAGRMEAGAFGQLLAGRPREEAGDTAGANGLYLERVSY